jgi:rhomboid protease GluP
MKTVSRLGAPPQAPESLTELMRSSPARSPLTHGFLLLNLLVFLAMLSKGAGLWHTANGVQLAWGANFGPATQDGQWWRLVTAMFIHFGIVHLAMNLWALRDVGRLVERLYGPWRFATLYVGSGILGNLLSLVVQGNHAVSGGASGAIFGLYGALLVFLWRERRQVMPSEFRWLFGAASVFTVLMLSMGWVIPGIDNAAHGGGLLGGALLARVLARPWTAHSPHNRLGQGWALLVLLAGTSWLAGHIPAPSYLFREELKARAAIQSFTLADQRITQQWGEILSTAPRQRLSFEQLAGRIESTVTAGYERSFEQLMAATPESQAPSAAALEGLQAYALQRAQASRDLAEGLRTNDADKIRQALRQAQRAATGASRGLAPSSAASTAK